LGETEESEQLISEMFPQNSARVQKQKKAPLKVIIGNPPYSVGQKSTNDNAQNQKYEHLDKRIASTYAALTDATNKNSLYDSYIKAFRWSTDRLDKGGGIICFVSNGGWLDGNSTAGFRKCLEKEFSSIYVFNLRGNQRTSGELSRREGGKIFGSGSRTPIAVTLLVKNPSARKNKASIHYHDIGDYLGREEKLAMVKKFGTVANADIKWGILQPNEHGDWISQRNDVFETFISIGDRDKLSQSVFNLYSGGLQTNRDSWTYNYSQTRLVSLTKQMIEFYNSQVVDLGKYCDKHALKPEDAIDKVIDNDPRKISWTRGLRNDLARYKDGDIGNGSFRIGPYRPFCKQAIFLSNQFNEYVNKMEVFFPNGSVDNLVLCVSSRGTTSEFASLIVNSIPNVEFVARCQCFPLYYYEERQKEGKGLFDTDESNTEYVRRDGISDFILERARRQYGKNVTKEDIFYYVYGFLHSPEYRSTFANDLKKMLPRLPLVEDVRHFWAFSKAGRALAELHINYESVPAAPGVVVVCDTVPQESINKALRNGKLDVLDYRVEKMRFPKKGQTDTIIYNSQITIENIPAEAYEYVVNGKSAIEWIMERYQVTVHKESGIKNDPNDWAEEVGNRRYILDLLLSVINVSIQTVKIVEGLPKTTFA
ncbi:MAG TPA: type ISP restriction/modification enzyme, partial [Sedimentisphaerales bacterium]|nr:type ISP restriction/modification enzyme [Sedimentisphaerales bacterium]